MMTLSQGASVATKLTTQSLRQANDASCTTGVQLHELSIHTLSLHCMISVAATVNERHLPLLACLPVRILKGDPNLVIISFV